MSKRVICFILSLCFIMTFALPIISAEEGERAGEPFEYTLLSDGTYKVTRYNGNAKNVVVPNEYNGCPITAIGDVAFLYDSDLENVTLPGTLNSIGVDAFRNTKLMENFHNGSDEVLYIGEYLIKAKENAFKSGEYTVKVGTVLIADYAFFNCRNLKKVKFPETVIYIGNSAFGYCSSLAGINLPYSISRVGKFAFEYCDSLLKVTLPNDITEIGEGAFEGTGYYNNKNNWDKDNVLYISKYLIKVGRSVNGALGYLPFEKSEYTVKDGIKLIAGGAFYKANKLQKVTLPKSIAYINADAFDGCNALTVVYNGTKAEWSRVAVGSGNKVIENAEIRYNGDSTSSAKVSSAVTGSKSSETASKSAKLKAPKKSKFLLKKGKKRFRIKLKKIKGAKKLQFAYKLKSKKVKKWHLSKKLKNKTKYYKSKKLKKGKKYLVRIRYYKGKRKSLWSKSKTIVIK